MDGEHPLCCTSFINVLSEIWTTCKRTTEPVSHRPQRAYAVAHLPGAVPGGRDPRGPLCAGLWPLCDRGLTDALDGLLARVLKQRSVLGEYLDPVATSCCSARSFWSSCTRADANHGHGAGLRQGCGHPGCAAILYAAAGRREFNPSLWARPTRWRRSPRWLPCCCISSHGQWWWPFAW